MSLFNRLEYADFFVLIFVFSVCSHIYFDSRASDVPEIFKLRVPWITICEWVNLNMVVDDSNARNKLILL